MKINEGNNAELSAVAGALCDSTGDEHRGASPAQLRAAPAAAPHFSHSPREQGRWERGGGGRIAILSDLLNDLLLLGVEEKERGRWQS